MIKTTQTWKIGDCLKLLPEIPDNSIDMILTDLPYGTTACSWDTIIPFEPLWKQYERIIKDNGAMVFTSVQPFTSKLVLSNLNLFKYELIWDKNYGISPGTAKYRPMASHESVLVFGKGVTKYNPQMTIGKAYSDIRNNKDRVCNNEHKYGYTKYRNVVNDGERYPLSVIFIQKFNKEGQHPTEKPLELFEYLIKTYTNEGDTVHDSCLGSGTTLEACFRTNRNCIGFEISNEWEPYYIKHLHMDTAKIKTSTHTLNNRQSLMEI